MVFSSVPFLFYFFPIVLVLYFVSPKKLRNGILFLSSLVFYAWGEPIYVTIMLFSTLVDYTHGLWIEKYQAKGEHKKARWVVASSVVINLALLCFFKYSDFFLTNTNQMLGLHIPLLALPLPIGISFYTFQTMSYSIDVYRGEAKAQHNIISFGAYVALFPQLIAGPIVRYQTIADQLNERQENFDQFAYGAGRFMQGLGKKVLLANNIGYLWSIISAQNPETLPVATAWLGVLAFGFQIYFDFSGYSDMAIGLGNLFGFTFLENFNYPYISKSITEFWRRWHISLGTWFRKYVYVPLGGNRGSKAKTLRNIFVVWLLTGFWHGASWNFVVWGLYFWALLMVEKFILRNRLEKLPQCLQHFYALFFIGLGWVIFAFDDFGTGVLYLKSLFGLGGNPLWNTETLYLLRSNLLLILLLALGATPWPKRWAKALFAKKEGGAMDTTANLVFIAMIFVFSVAYIINSSYNPFLYFRF